MSRAAYIAVLFILLCTAAFADRIVQTDSFDDGNLTADPRWEFVQPGPVTVSGERSTSGAYSLKVASNNEMGAVRTFTGLIAPADSYTCTFNLYIESMGDEAIPWSLQNPYAGMAAIIFILPGGKVQLHVPDGGSGKYSNVAQPISYGAWHAFRVTYDGSTTNLYLDDHTSPDASITQTYVREPSRVCIGNFVMPHTSTFYIDDLTFSRPGDAVAPARIYVQVCSDTSTGGINIGSRYIDFPEADETYTTPGGQAARVMSEAYRYAHRDSLGNPIKFTWYMQTGSLYAAGTDSGALLPYELMEDHHGDAIRRWGDEMAYHYHTWIWSDPNGDGKYYWNQAPDFSYCLEDFDITVAQMLVDRAFYPASFRSGWHYMDNLWQRCLDDLFPYRFENDWPAYRVDSEEPVDNVYDWRRAPSDWAPYHPDPNDYQSPGTLRGWDSRSKYINGATTVVLTDAFIKALNGEPQLLTLFSHLKEADFPEQVDALHQRLTDLHASFPLVEFEYLTGRECMLKWRGGTDVTPPSVQITAEDDGDTRTATLEFSEEIYQPQPFVARKGADGSYSRLECIPAGTNRWQVRFRPADTISVAVGATDWFGNACVRFLRTPLRLTDVEVTLGDSTSADVAWRTNLPADSRVVCTRVDSGAVQTVSDEDRALVHRIRLRDLSPGAIYRLVVSCADEFGQRVESEPICFLTKAREPVVIDNLDAGFSVEGSWSAGSTTSGAYGPDYRYAMTSPTGTARAHWTWQVAESGIYRIQARWSAGTNRTTTAAYSVEIGGDTHDRVVNQQIDGGQWNTLCVSELSAGDQVTVTLSNAAASGPVVIADSIRFEPAFAPLPSIGLGRLLRDGESILISGAVTGVFGSFFYVESIDRSSAIRVQGSGVAEGDVVSVGGRLTTVSGERVVIAEHIGRTTETTHLRPVGVIGRSMPETIGLLVTVWGRVASVGDAHFYLDDGSGPGDCAGDAGLRVDSTLLSAPPVVGDYAVVTGIVSVETAACGQTRIIRPRRCEDIVLYASAPETRL